MAKVQLPRLKRPADRSRSFCEALESQLGATPYGGGQIEDLGEEVGNLKTLCIFLTERLVEAGVIDIADLLENAVHGFEVVE